MGEHAAVYGQPALIAAVDPRARVEVAPTVQDLQVELKDFGKILNTDWDEVRVHADRSRLAWQRYADRPSPERFAEIGSGSPENLVLVALGEVARLLESRDLPPLTLRIDSRLPVGSGFGSSAAIAVALIGGVLTYAEGRTEPADVDIVAMEVERRQHGMPSGVDHKTVLFGGVVLAERGAGGDLEIDRLDRGSPTLARLQIYQTGQPAETTGQVVAAVRKYRDENPELVDGLLQNMGRAVRSFRDELAAPVERPLRINDLMLEYQGYLEELGVVPEVVRETIRQIEMAGGGAKVSGAGTLTGEAAGCLLVHWPAGPPERLPVGLAGYQRLDVELGVDGLRMEEDR